jgi:3',5'-cyclic AMP phosphodiesterase CpdA
MSTPGATPAVRLAHFSDIHVTARPLGWRAGDYFSKRFTGWLNLALLGRGYRFRGADAVLAALVADLRRRRPDHLVFSGDATTLGFESEFAKAAALLRVGGPDSPPGLAVPGNHDYYTRAAAASGLFERYFAPWQVGERVDGATYPFAQRTGNLWLVGVNSSSRNPMVWDASGRVDPAQLDRLGRLLGRLSPGPRVLVTHYPVCVASGRRERRTHGLRNLEEIVRIAARGGVCLWLHGHRHGLYQLARSDLAPFPVVCAGSATQHGRWAYAEHAVAGGVCTVTWRTYHSATGAFEETQSQTLELPGAVGAGEGAAAVV